MRRQRITRSHVRIPSPGFFDCALLGFEIHVGQAEALTETFRPLEVIHETPRVIAANVGAIGDGASQ